MNHAPAENSFFRWIRGLGVQRGERHWIGGVSSGLGQRFGIDTALARGIVLVIVIFSGVGLLLYGVAWALLPGPDGRIHLQEAGRGQWSAGMTGAVVFAVIGLANGPFVLGGWRFDDGDSWWGGLIWTALVVAAAIWFFSSRPSRQGNTGNQHDGGAPTGAPGDPGAASPSAVYEGPSASAAYRPYEPQGRYPASPATGGPGTASTAGTATAAGVGPGPTRPLPPRRPQALPRPAVPGHSVAVVLGLAVLVAGAVILTSMNGILDYGGREATVALAAATTVLGAGLVGAAIRKLRGGALTGFTIALLVPTLLVGGLGNQFAADRSWPGPVVERNGNDYTYVFNSGNLDLTSYADMTEDTTLSVTNVFSSLKVTVPADIPVRVAGDSAFYSLEVHTAEGVQKYSGIARDDTVNINPDATGPVLRLDIDGAFNSIDITSQEVTP